MDSLRAIWVLGLLLAANPVIVDPILADDLLPASLYGEMGGCLTPVETYPYKLDRSDPFYQAALEDHQRYLEELEDYVNCLDHERASAWAELRASFDLFMKNFGRDAVLKYAAKREAVRD